ncbi:MAG: PAS domain S-box protein [Verrucomicrobiota bacterium]
MRDYVRRLLSERYLVQAVADGEAALVAARENPPDLVLCDVMMPRLDGFGLLRELRADPHTRSIPVVLLSARAGEESRVAGMDSGADDYLVKPFSGRELLARVGAHLNLARVRREAYAALRESEERYRTLFNSMDEGFCIIEMIFDEDKKPVDFRYLEVNPAFEKQTGMADPKGKRMRELVPQTEQYWFDINGRVFLTGEAIRFENEAASLHRWYDVYSFPVELPEGRRVGIVFNDITARKQAEKTLHQRTEQIETLINKAPLGIYLVDSDFSIRQMNPIAVPVFGDIPDIIGRDFDEVIHRLWPNAVADEVVRKFRHTLETGEPYFDPELAEQRADRGVKEYYEWRLERTALSDGSSGVICYFRDISAQVLAREAIRESAERLRFMAESMPQKIFTAKPSGEVDYFNAQWMVFTGLTFEQIRDRGWTQIIHPDDVDRNILVWRHSIETGKAFEFEHRFRRHDGVYRWHLSRAHAMRDAEGKVLMWIGTNTDIDDQKRAEENLEKTVNDRTASLRETIEQLEEFSYSVSHDLRAPLRAMQGYANAVLTDYGDKIAAEGKDYLQRISKAGMRMDQLISDTLTYSKVARASMPRNTVSLDKLIPEMIQHYPQMHAAQAKITVENPLLPVLGNETWLTQAISNLLSNAVKFAAEGTKPEIRIRTEGRDGQVRLWVEDNGIGIKPEHQSRLFGMFERLNPSNQYEGTGIGLAIVRKSIERMDGTVGLASDGKTGSQFWIQLPAPQEKS